MFHISIILFRKFNNLFLLIENLKYRRYLFLGRKINNISSIKKKLFFLNKKKAKNTLRSY